MKVKLLTTISFFTYQFSISQTEKLLHGKVISNNNSINKVEVINKTAKTSTRTNELGDFSIMVKEKDSLLFFVKDYFFTRLKISQANMDQNNIIVNMVVKAEELNEVVVTNIKFPHVGTANADSNVIPSSSLQKYTGVNDGTIVNGMNFIAIGGFIADLFKKENEAPKKKVPEINFKKLVATSIPSSFFTKDLKLNVDEVNLFIDFCDADLQSKKLLENNNVLTTMDFLYAKSDVFKKFKTESRQ